MTNSLCWTQTGANRLLWTYTHLLKVEYTRLLALLVDIGHLAVTIRSATCRDVCKPFLWQYNPMIVAVTYPPINIDLSKDEPDMILQRLDSNDWVNYKVDGKVVKSPVDIETLPQGKYRLV